MPDIDPAALSRPAVTLSTPVLSTKTLSINATGSAKITKTSQIIPARIDLEPLYTALKSAISSEQWLIYKEATAEFLTGRLSQAEYCERIDPILAGDNGEKDHLHNQLIAAIYGNVTREMPDQGIAPWVSANDKPVASAGSKPVTGDAAERRLKGDVMQLLARDRRRIKDLVHNDPQYDPHENLSNLFADTHRRPSATTDVPASAAGGINKMNFDLEIRKRFAQPLAVESGEFPDVGMITGRMLPFCYEAGLASGHVGDAPQLMSVATEAYIKEILTQIFSRTRSNGPGDSGSAGFGIGTTWIQTCKYRKQLSQEEDAAQRGEITRDKSGMLPVEAKAASERGPLAMGDMRLALEMADTGMAQFPVLMTQVLYGYREGELENWHDYSWVDGRTPVIEEIPDTKDSQALPNGHPDNMDIDNEAWWDGGDTKDVDMLDGILDSCLMVG
ncbi:cAMP-dependent protein kinase regulatory subunit [Purpureocillium lavendulum]|uniref:cAMP-dependent protein kinase regulatory subunit n=1 Tax=Purpureocillium lavendulum TaxID=1247861 RepID=A0AB34FW40_9HYPO|nr:cAMP-dependent protein kinase regulatory subunit [Purpureocillium lavendulum]